MTQSGVTAFKLGGFSINQAWLLMRGSNLDETPRMPIFMLLSASLFALMIGFATLQPVPGQLGYILVTRAIRDVSERRELASDYTRVRFQVGSDLTKKFVVSRRCVGVR
jgi:hypothetical protein